MVHYISLLLLLMVWVFLLTLIVDEIIIFTFAVAKLLAVYRRKIKLKGGSS